MGLEFRECEGYEAGDEHHPMHTDPLCRLCGAPKRSAEHANR
jgi:hypothetical protein